MSRQCSHLFSSHMPSYFSSSSAVSLILALRVATMLPAAPDILKLRRIIFMRRIEGMLWSTHYWKDEQIIIYDLWHEGKLQGCCTSHNHCSIQWPNHKQLVYSQLIDHWFIQWTQIISTFLSYLGDMLVTSSVIRSELQRAHESYLLLALCTIWYPRVTPQNYVNHKNPLTPSEHNLHISPNIKLFAE